MAYDELFRKNIRDLTESEEVEYRRQWYKWNNNVDRNAGIFSADFKNENYELDKKIF